MTQHRAIAPQMYPGSRILSQDEFEKLKRQIQLLRISQLRFIVQKYKLPANGNKTRLIQIVLHLLDAMRNTVVLSNLNDDVLRIISTLNEPFANPLDLVHKISTQPPPEISDLVFETPAHHLIQYPEITNPDNSSIQHPPILGPLYVLPGVSSGKFTFSIEPLLSQSLAENIDANTNPLQYRVCLDFGLSDQSVSSFEIDATLNGIGIHISPSDPDPMPLDITDLLQRKTTVSTAVIEFKSVQTQQPMTIMIRPYKLVTIKSIVSNLLQTEEALLSTDWQTQDIRVKGRNCAHEDSFSLIPYLAHSIARNNFVCPLCNSITAIDDIILITNENVQNEK